MPSLTRRLVRQRRPRAVRYGYLLPVGAWVAAMLTIAGATWSDRHSPFTQGTWMHWDAFQYLDQAAHGYTLFHCNVGGLERWCGNSGWFPGYPWVIRLFRLVGVDGFAAAMVLSWGFSLGAVVLVWRGFCPRVDFSAAATVTFAAFTPGAVYYFAPFPLSMVAFFGVLYLFMLSREEWMWAGLAAIPLVLVYPIGLLAPISAGVWLLIVYRAASNIAPPPGYLTASVVPIFAIAIVPVSQALSVGHWDAFYDTQSNFDYGLQSPLHASAQGLHLLREFHFDLADAPSWQSLLVAVVFLAVIGALLVRWRTVSAIEVLIVVWLLLTWLLVQSKSGLSAYRSEAALLPLAILVGRLPAAYSWRPRWARSHHCCPDDDSVHP